MEPLMFSSTSLIIWNSSSSVGFCPMASSTCGSVSSSPIDTRQAASRPDAAPRRRWCPSGPCQRPRTPLDIRRSPLGSAPSDLSCRATDLATSPRNSSAAQPQRSFLHGESPFCHRSRNSRPKVPSKKRAPEPLRTGLLGRERKPALEAKPLRSLLGAKERRWEPQVAPQRRTQDERHPARLSHAERRAGAHEALGAGADEGADLVRQLTRFVWRGAR
eukprot:scaffold149_cov315-Pinguiococcus_pyrenoidosus.AAC.56